MPANHYFAADHQLGAATHYPSTASTLAVGQGLTRSRINTADEYGQRVDTVVIANDCRQIYRDMEAARLVLAIFGRRHDSLN